MTNKTVYQYVSKNGQEKLQDQKNYKSKRKTENPKCQFTHHVAITKQSSHTCYGLLDLKHTQLLYLNMGHKACHAILHVVREAAWEFKY